MIYWGLPVSLILSKPQQDSTPVIAFLIAVYFVIPISLISCIHYILFGKSRPRWLPKLKSMWVGIYSWIVINLSTFISFGIVIPFIDPYLHSYYKYGNFGFTDTEASWLSAIWLITATYLYQTEYLLRRWLTANSKRVTRSSVSNKSVFNNSALSDIDIELNRLRGDMGFYKMKGKGKSKPNR